MKKLTEQEWARIPELREKGMMGRLSESEQDLVYRAWDENYERYIEATKGIRERVQQEIQRGERFP